MPIKITFIGAGRMASAIVRGLLEKEHYNPEEIACTCGDDTTGPALAKATGIQFLPDITPALHETESVILACNCLLYTSPSPRDGLLSRMPSSA